jgi:cobalt-zinc-cadmium efflux system outer membrane protein
MRQFISALFAAGLVAASPTTHLKAQVSLPAPMGVQFPQQGKVKDHTDHPAPPKAKMDHDAHKEHGKQGEENPLPDIASPASAVGPAITLAELEFLGLQHNPTLVQASMQIEAARAKALQARLWPNPTIGYVGEQIGQLGTAGEFQGGFVQQEIITAGKRRLSGAKYDQQAQTAELQCMLQQLKVLNGIREGFYKLLAVEQTLHLRRVLLQNATEDYRTTLEEHNIGRKDKAEVLFAKNRLNKAKIDLRSEENRREMYRREVVAAIGLPDLDIRQLSGRLTPASAPLQWESSLSRLLTESPELMVAKSHIAFEELSLKRELVEPIPNITVRGMAGYNAVEKQTVAGAQVSIPIPLWNRNQGNIRMVQADIQRSLAEVRRIELSLQKQLAGEFNKYQNALSWVTTYEKENLPNLKEAYEVYLDQYQKRRLAWPEVVRVHRELAEEYIRYTEKALTLREHEVAISGLLVGNGLAQPSGPTPGGHIEVSPQPR